MQSNAVDVKSDVLFFEVRYSRHMNLLTAIGLLSAFQAVRRLIIGGTLWCGIPCNSWVWVSRGSTLRSRLRPGGAKRRYKGVRKMNRLVRRVCYLLLDVFRVAFYLNLFHSFSSCVIMGPNTPLTPEA